MCGLRWEVEWEARVETMLGTLTSNEEVLTRVLNKGEGIKEGLAGTKSGGFTLHSRVEVIFGCMIRMSAKYLHVD